MTSKTDLCEMASSAVEDELTASFRKGKLKMWDGSWAMAEKSMERCLPLAAEVFGNDSFVVAAIHFEVTECKFSLSEAMPTRADAEELTAAAWSSMHEGLAILRARKASAGGISFADPRIMRAAEVTYRKLDSTHSVKERQPQNLKRTQAKEVLLSGANFWAYSMFIKCAYFASHRFVTHVSALRFAPFTSPNESEECRQLLLEGLRLLNESAAVGFVSFSEEMKLFEHMLKFSEQPEEIVHNFFGGDGFKLGEIQKAFTATFAVLGPRGLLRNTSVGQRLQGKGQNFFIGKQEKFFADRSQKEHARQMEKGGLKMCSLAACATVEQSAGQHKICSRCRTVRYCCVDHQRQDWKLHKPHCVPK
jgi:hypothetical protein